MEHPEVLPGGRNAKHSVNNNNSNNQISKRSNIMDATKFFSRGLITLLSLLLLVGVTFGQNLVLGGSTTTYGGTWNVKGNIDNTAMAVVVGFTGTVNLKGTAAQSIGVATKPEIDFGSLKATGVSTKTFNVPSAITTNIDASTGTTTQFALNGNKLTLSGTITNTGTATAPYDFAAAGSEVDYHGAAQSVWSGVTYDKLTVSAAGGDKTLGGNVTVASALSVSAGNLAIAANTLTVNGTYSAVGTVTGGATSNITLNGSGDLAAFTVTNGLNNFVVNRPTNTVTLSTGLAINNVLTLTAGTLAVSTQTLTLNGTGAVISVGAGSLSSAATGTVDYHQNAQAVIAANYGNLTFTAGVKTLASSGTIGIAGTFTPDASPVVTGSTIDFNGAAQNIPAFTFNHLLTHGAGSTKTATGNISVGGNFDNGGASNDAVTLTMGTNTLAVTGTKDNTSATIQFAAAGNGLAVSTGTVEYNGLNSVTQTIAAGQYATLLLSNASGSGVAAKSIASGASVLVSAGMSVPALTSLTLVDGTSVLDVNATLSVFGAVINNGTVTVGD